MHARSLGREGDRDSEDGYLIVVDLNQDLSWPVKAVIVQQQVGQRFKLICSTQRQRIPVSRAYSRLTAFHVDLEHLNTRQRVATRRQLY